MNGEDRIPRKNDDTGLDPSSQKSGEGRIPSNETQVD